MPKKKKSKSLSISKLEKSHLEKYTSIVGIDEVGRGCMAGPMSVGAFKLDTKHVPLNGINDSKILTKKQREEVYPNISKYEYKVIHIEHSQIDKHGLTVAFKRSIAKILDHFSDPNTLFIVDGNLKFREFENVISIIDADALLYSVAAASILAKVERDNLMTEYAKKYPTYGFETHVGYATKKHRDAVLTYGVTPIHRKSYKFIRELKQIELDL